MARDIIEAARKIRQRRFVLDGEAVVLGVDGVPDFNALHSRQQASEGIFVRPFEQGEIGPDLFKAACKMGLEGIVSKHRDRPYQAGRSKYWIKVKNRTHARCTE
jgi:ATP-dependent DNA ligase